MSCTMMDMMWARKGIVFLLSGVLLFALTVGTIAVSVNITLSHPAKLETWLTQSNLYTNLIDNTIKQAEASAKNNLQSNGISINDTVVQQAVKSTLTPTLLQQYVNTFLTSNYAWLEGKAATPNFSIDLSGVKASFAQKLGQYVQDRLSSLPLCTTVAQILSQPTSDPMSMTCRPATLSPAIVGAQVIQKLQTSSDFLSNPVITASSLNPNGGGSGQPYYQKLSFAPKAYRAAAELPWVLGSLAVLSAIGITFIAPRKRQGLRRVSVVLLEAGTILIATKFVVDIVFKNVATKVFNNTGVGPLQQSLTDFAHRAETQLVSSTLYTGIGFMVLALAIITALILTRNRGSTLPAGPNKPPATPVTDTPPQPAIPPQPVPPQPPRLVQ